MWWEDVVVEEQESWGLGVSGLARAVAVEAEEEGDEEGEGGGFDLLWVYDGAE